MCLYQNGFALAWPLLVQPDEIKHKYYRQEFPVITYRDRQTNIKCDALRDLVPF